MCWKEQGVAPSELTTPLQSVHDAIQKTLQDTRGQWILQNHPEAQSEYPLTAIINNEMKSLIIDRTFVTTDGIRWIIDYKTAHFAGNSIEEFMDQQQQQYQKQLNYYSQAMRQLDPRPIRVGLYFPLIPTWREFTPDCRAD